MNHPFFVDRRTIPASHKDIKISQPWLPVILGIVAILCILIIGIISVIYTVEFSRQTYRHLYLAKASLLANAASHHTQLSDQELIKTLEELWKNIPNRPADEYLCIVSPSKTYLLHTSSPERAGVAVKNGVLSGNKEYPATSVQELLKKDNAVYVGNFTSTSGEVKLAVFVNIPSRHWVLGIHRSQRAMLKDLFSTTRFIIYGYLIVCLVLFPCTLWLFYWRVSIIQERLLAYLTALEKSEWKYSQLFSGMRDGFALYELVQDEHNHLIDFKFLEVNPAFEEVTGVKKENIIGKTIRELMPGLKSAWIENIGKQVKEGKSVRFEDYYSALDKYLEVNVFSSEEGQFATIVRDITARIKAEKALRESEARFRKALYEAPFPVILYAEDGEILLVSKTWSDITGYTPEDIPNIEVWIQKAYGEKKNQMRDYIKTVFDLESPRDDGEYTVNTKSGDTRLWYFSSSPLGRLPDGRRLVISMALDITESKKSEAKRHQLEEQLASSQRLESIGRLAAGVAHDYNNLLTVILGNTEFLMEGKTLDHPDYDYILQIQATIEKATALTRQLLAFGRRQVMEIRPLDINQLIDNFLKMMKRLLGEDIELIVHLQPDIPPVSGDSTSLEQVLMNLCVNARDAMPQGGKIIIETEAVVLEETQIGSHPDLHPGKWIILSVTDNGAGMEQETLKHIFEPFFTTKKIGKGTGLGLATCYGIIKQHNGDISVYSEPGHGTTFKIYLPISIEPALPRAEPVETSTAMLGTETILVVEDEVSVRNMTCAFLRDRGYRVLESLTPENALEILQKSGKEINLMLTDVIMPGMDGKTLYEKAKQIYPELKVLFMSGYPDEIITPRGILTMDVPFLQKPFNSQKLAQKIREILNQP
jgi:PAS domain S-box-containing protein